MPDNIFDGLLPYQKEIIEFALSGKRVRIVRRRRTGKDYLRKILIEMDEKLKGSEADGGSDGGSGG